MIVLPACYIFVRNLISWSLFRVQAVQTIKLYCYVQSQPDREDAAWSQHVDGTEQRQLPREPDHHHHTDHSQEVCTFIQYLDP